MVRIPTPKSLISICHILIYARVNARSHLGSRKDQRRLVARPLALVRILTLLTRRVQKEPLPTNFPCLFCNHEKSVSAKLDKKAGIGELCCKVCGQQFQTGINCKCQGEIIPQDTSRSSESRLTMSATDLSAAVDVYSDWIDACDSVAKEAAHAGAADDGFNSYQDLAAGNERRNSEMNVDRHLVAAVGGNEYGRDLIDDN